MNDAKLSERIASRVFDFQTARAKHVGNQGTTWDDTAWASQRAFDDCAGLLIDNADAILAALRAAESPSAAETQGELGALKLSAEEIAAFDVWARDAKPTEAMVDAAKRHRSLGGKIRGASTTPISTAEAVEAEQEAIAALFDNVGDEILTMWDRPGGPPGNGYVRLTGKLVAATIRARKEG